MASHVELAFESTRSVTREEFAAWLATRPRTDCNHYELLRGRVVMTPPAGYPHGLVEGAVSRVLAPFVHERGLGVLMGSSQGFELPSGDTVEPDVSVVLAERWAAARPEVGAFLRVVPDLIVEILSPSTAPRDRGEKRDIYEQNGVREYWIIDPRQRQLTVFTLVESAFDAGVVYATSDASRSALLPDLTIDVAALFPPEPAAPPAG